MARKPSTKKTNRELLTQGDKAYAQKKAKKHGVEEVKFDRDARAEYLTGFHKRKLERKEKAQKKAMEEERQAKLAERKKMREERKELAEKDLERFKNAMSEITQVRGDLVDNMDDSDKTESGNEDEEEEFSDWDGIDGDDDNERPKKGVLKKHKYDDDDDTNPNGTTTVTVEEFNLNTDDESENEILKENNVDLSKSDKVLKSSLDKAEQSAFAWDIQKKKMKAMMAAKKKSKRRVPTKKTIKKSATPVSKRGGSKSVSSRRK